MAQEYILIEKLEQKNDAKSYDDVKQYYAQQWYRDTNNDFSQNPYWILNRVASDENRGRTMVSGTVRYEILDGLSIQGRLSYDKTTDEWERKVHASTSQVLANVDGYYEKNITN